MAEQWIPASKALEIVGNPVALCTRLHAGLSLARAESFLVDGKKQEAGTLPKGFWWATGHEALEQDWSAGDFSTWIDRTHHLQAFGVSMALTGLLEVVEFEKRAELVLSLSIAGSNDWMSADEVLKFIHSQAYLRNASGIVIEQARLGFISARAVQATGSMRGINSDQLFLEEREWNVPTWFWNEFTKPNAGSQNWGLGKFSGHGLSPYGRAQFDLQSVHFLRSSIEARFGIAKDVEAEPPVSPRGRKPTYDWPTANSAIWGRLYRGELIPENQADIERAFQTLLAKGDKEPSESTVRPFAKQIWEEFQKA